MEYVMPEEFDSKVLSKNKKTVVLFYASWCHYCSNFKLTFEASELKFTDKMEALIDEDENPLWDRFNIQTVPTMIVFENGKAIARRDGKKNIGLTKSDMDSLVKELD